MMQIASIRQIELLAMLALPLRRTLHRQTQEFELPLLQAPRPRSKKISASTGPIDSEKTTAKWRVRRDTEKADGAAPLRHYN
jgi:hypothetical protein